MQSEDRLTLVETKLAYLEDFVNTLQELSVAHTKAIDRLSAENKTLREKLGEIGDSMRDTPQTRPPHY